jgi:hypothetical protein
MQIRRILGSGLVSLSLLMIGPGFLAGCEQESEFEEAAEETGEAVEEGVEETGETLEEGMEETGDAIENAG